MMSRARMGKSTRVTPHRVSGDLYVFGGARSGAASFAHADSALERAQYYQWIFYAMDTLSPIVHTVYLRWFLAAPGG